MTDVNLVNNLWVLICGLLVFSMTVSVGLLEIGELGENYSKSLLKTLLITGSALFFMAFLGFNTAFAPTIGGIIGNPLYGGGVFLGGFSSTATGLLSGVWWSMDTPYFATGLTTGTYFLFETAFAAVTLALVGVVVLRKMKLEAFLAFSVVYFVVIWSLPAAWIWNPTGWLYLMGVRDFAGGLVVHGAAGAAGLAIVHRIWREEKKKGSEGKRGRPLKRKSGLADPRDSSPLDGMVRLQSRERPRVQQLGDDRGPDDLPGGRSGPPLGNVLQIHGDEEES